MYLERSNKQQKILIFRSKENYNSVITLMYFIKFLYPKLLHLSL